MSASVKDTTTLEASLDHVPVELAFGTSGRRGRVLDLTQLEVYLTVRGELDFLLTLPRAEGGIRGGDDFLVAADLRPSSTRRTPEGQGELAQVILRAVADAGLKPVFLGAIPTPALAAYAFAQGLGSLMVTGSHIPFDRNGFKTNRSIGELLKPQEAPIAESVGLRRAQLYKAPYAESPFDASGRFRVSLPPLPNPDPRAEEAYLERYRQCFSAEALRGLRILFYQHSAVGRDLIPAILTALGAEVICAGRSTEFVPIDTENIDADCLQTIQELVDQVLQDGQPLDAVVSTDGDSDRPLILGFQRDSRTLRFFGGDLVGMITAEALKPDAVIVPISCNDAIDQGPLASVLSPKTRIGSPFVIEGMEQARARGCRRVVGFEANGGFLTGSDLALGQGQLLALPTRDAVLPILAVLSKARQLNVSLSTLFDRLPHRFSRAGLLKRFPRVRAWAILEALSPKLEQIAASGGPIDRPQIHSKVLQRLDHYFGPSTGFALLRAIDLTDGLRLLFENGEVLHLRPSGNADEFRVYAVADSQPRADALVAMSLEEPLGLLRRLEQEL